MTASEVASFILECVRETFRRAACTPCAVTVALFPDDLGGYAGLHVARHGELMCVGIHSAYLSVTAWVPVEARS